MRELLLATVAFAGCSSEPGNRGQATTIIDPDFLVVAITHEQVGIDVYRTNDFLITGHRKGMRGKLLDSEMITLKSHISDEIVKTLGRECGGNNEYRITIGAGSQSRCWKANQKGAALEGLATFFNDKAAMLAATPEGKCSGVQNVGESNRAKEKAAAAGSAS